MVGSMKSGPRDLSRVFAWFAWSVSVVAFLLSVLLMMVNVQYDGRGSEVLVEAIEDVGFVEKKSAHLAILTPISALPGQCKRRQRLG